MFYKFIIKSPVTCAVTIDGRYLGECGRIPLIVRAAKKGSYFIKTVFAGAPGVRYKDSAIIFRPDDCCGCDGAEVIRYSGSTYVLQLSAQLIAATGIFQPLEQVLFEQSGLLHTATLYSDGISYLELECQDWLTKKPLDFTLCAPKLIPVNLSGNSFLLLTGVQRDGGNCIYAYCFNGSEYVTLKLCGSGDFKLQDDTLIITSSHNTIMRHNTVSTYIYKDNALVLKGPPAVSASVLQKTDARLIPYVFLEAVMTDSREEAIGYLDKKQYADIEFIQLQNYLGEFDAVVHNIFDSGYIDCAGIIKRAGNNYYTAEYYKFDVFDAAIQNITEVN